MRRRGRRIIGSTGMTAVQRSPQYEDTPAFQASAHLYKVLTKRLRMPIGRAMMIARTMNMIRRPGELFRRALPPDNAGPAIDRGLGYMIPRAGVLPGADDAAAACRLLFSQYDHGRLTEIQSRAKKPFMIMLDQDEQFAAAPAVLRLLLSDELIRMVSAYFGRVPRLANVHLAWSPANSTVVESQLFHVDHADRRQIKLFMNVTDTAADQGPFTFLPASASERILRRVTLNNRRITDDVLADRIGPITPVTFTGAAGSALLVDTSRCLHYGSRMNRRDRLMLMAQFTDFYAPRVARSARWSMVTPILGPLTPLQETVLAIRPLSVSRISTPAAMPTGS